MIVDLHSHYFPLDAVLRAGWSPLEITPPSAPGDHYRVAFGRGSNTLPTALTDLDAQLADLRRTGLERRALIVPPYTVLYELPADDGLRWSRLLNDAMAEAARSNPSAFVGFGTAPLQDVDRAIQELDRATSELGLRGIQILTNVHGVELDAPALEPFWAALERLGVPALIHPHHVAGANRMGDYYLRNLVGNPSETALAGARLLLGGVLERYPALKLILSHGGGSLPALIGRLRHGFAHRPDVRTRATAPIENLRRLYYDSIVFDPASLRYLVETVGASQVVLGSDYPYDMSEADPVPFLASAGLADSEQETILHSADRLLRGGD